MFHEVEKELAKVKNKVISGDYIGQSVVRGYGKGFYFLKRLSRTNFVKSDVSSYELIDDINKTSIWSTFIRGYVGHMVFGIPGLATGVISSFKNKEYLFSLNFKNGKKSLLSIDRKTYEYLLKVLF